MLRQAFRDRLKKAMKARDLRTVSTVRLILAGLKERDVAERGQGDSEGLSEAEIQRMLQAMVKQLHLPEHVPVSYDIEQSGNTSAASIPLAMDRMLADGQAPHGGLALLIGFGAGLTYAAQVILAP